MRAANAIACTICFLTVAAVVPALAVDTVKGTVQSVVQTSTGGTHLVLTTASGAVEVCLGDSQLLKKNSFAIRIGDPVEVRGVLETSTPQPLLTAETITESGRTLALRCAVTPSQGRSGRHDCKGCTDDCAHADHRAQHHPEHH
jgi:hypothetical protein